MLLFYYLIFHLDLVGMAFLKINLLNDHLCLCMRRVGLKLDTRLEDVRITCRDML